MDTGVDTSMDTGRRAAARLSGPAYPNSASRINHATWNAAFCRESNTSAAAPTTAAATRHHLFPHAAACPHAADHRHRHPSG